MKYYGEFATDTKIQNESCNCLNKNNKKLHKKLALSNVHHNGQCKYKCISLKSNSKIKKLLNSISNNSIAILWIFVGQFQKNWNFSLWSQ